MVYLHLRSRIVEHKPSLKHNKQVITAPLSDAAKSTRRLRGEKYRLRVATALTRREYCPLRNATCKIVLRGGFFPSFSLISFDAELNLNKRGRYTATRFACRDSMTMGKSLHSIDAEEK